MDSRLRGNDDLAVFRGALKGRKLIDQILCGAVVHEAIRFDRRLARRCSRASSTRPATSAWRCRGWWAGGRAAGWAGPAPARGFQNTTPSVIIVIINVSFIINLPVKRFHAPVLTAIVVIQLPRRPRLPGLAPANFAFSPAMPPEPAAHRLTMNEDDHGAAGPAPGACRCPFRGVERFAARAQPSTIAAAARPSRVSVIPGGR